MVDSSLSLLEDLDRGAWMHGTAIPIYDLEGSAWAGRLFSLGSLAGGEWLEEALSQKEDSVGDAYVERLASLV